MAKRANGLAALQRKLHREANTLFESEEYQRFFALPLTRERARFYMIQRATFMLCRRGCWALVQARAPFDVKQLIWEHERDELAGNEQRGVADHYTLGIKEGASVGLKRKDFKRPACDGTLICTFAWTHLADRSPWLEGAAVLGALEIANADGIIEGGGQSHRMAMKMVNELGIPLSRQPSNQDHMDVEDEHSTFLMTVAHAHATGKDDHDLIMSGSRKTWAINRTWLGLMAKEMEKLRN